MIEKQIKIAIEDTVALAIKEIIKQFPDSKLDTESLNKVHGCIANKAIYSFENKSGLVLVDKKPFIFEYEWECYKQ